MMSKRLNDSERLEIIAKLQKHNPPSKRAVAHEYNVSEGAIRKLWSQKESILKCMEHIPESTRISTFCLTQARFPELEDQIFLWIDSMRRLKLELPPTIVMAKAAEIARSLNIEENEFKASWGWFQNFRNQKG